MIPIRKVHVLKPDPEAGVTLDHVIGLAESYAESGHRAPIVLGHPKDNSPAWGWVTACEREGENLYCDWEVTPELKNLMEEGRFSERSVAFYPTDPPVLRHIGLLGATPPRIKGLERIDLSEQNDDPFITSRIPMTNQLPTPATASAADFVRPVTLYALSEVLPGVKASNLSSEPTIANDQITGLVALSDGKNYSYTISKVGDQWKAETTLTNPEVITLSEQVADLRTQLARQKASATVEKLYAEHRLTEAILPKSQAVELIALCEGTPVAKMVFNLLNNLPPLVSETPVAPVVPKQEVEGFTGFQLSDTTQYQAVLAKAAEMGLDASIPQNFIKALNSL